LLAHASASLVDKFVGLDFLQELFLSRSW